MTPPDVLHRLLGAHLRALREAASRRQEDVAIAARTHGFDWLQATVAMIERGHRRLSLEEFFALPSIGRAAGLGEVPLADWITVGETASRAIQVSASYVLAPPAVEHRGDAERRAARRFGVSPAALTRAAGQRWGRSLTAERDDRLAGRVRATATVTGTLTIAPRSLQAHRARVTRQLLEELRAVLKRRTPKRRTT
jgi:transcriptional regulator with XRE-family HTH domain